MRCLARLSTRHRLKTPAIPNWRCKRRQAVSTTRGTGHGPWLRPCARGWGTHAESATRRGGQTLHANAARCVTVCTLPSPPWCVHSHSGVLWTPIQAQTGESGLLPNCHNQEHVRTSASTFQGPCYPLERCGAGLSPPLRGLKNGLRCFTASQNGCKSVFRVGFSPFCWPGVTRGAPAHVLYAVGTLDGA